MMSMRQLLSSVVSVRVDIMTLTVKLLFTYIFPDFLLDCLIYYSLFAQKVDNRSTESRFGEKCNSRLSFVEIFLISIPDKYY